MRCSRKHSEPARPEHVKNFCAFALAGVLPHEGFAQGFDDGEDDAPIVLEAAYTAEVWNLASGDGGKGVRYLDNADIIINADLERLIGARNTTLSVYGLYNNGAAFSGDIVGDVVGVCVGSAVGAAVGTAVGSGVGHELHVTGQMRLTSLSSQLMSTPRRAQPGASVTPLFGPTQ